MAYDIDNYEKLGALYKLVKGIGSWEATDENVDKIKELIDQAIDSLDGDTSLHFRYQTEIAKASGRKSTLQVRKLVDEEWSK